MKNGPYTLVLAPPGYPKKKYREKYAYEHHIVWWKAGRKFPGKNEVIKSCQISTQQKERWNQYRLNNGG